MDNNRNNTDMSNTIPLDDIFCSKAYIDVDNGIVYDRESHLAIGYMSPLTDSVSIKIKMPDLLDENYHDNFKKIEKNVLEYFSDKVFRHLSNDIYLHLDGGYLNIGRAETTGGAELKIPRVYYDEDEEAEEEELDEEAEEWTDPFCFHPDGTRKTPHEMVLELMGKPLESE